MISFIWAEDLDGTIGKNGQLPWHLPADMRRFKEFTTNHTIVMGKRTYESLKRPLPQRRNIVLSNALEPIDGVEIVRDAAELETVLKSLTDDVYIIGGAIVFSTTFGWVNQLIKTVVSGHFAGDTKMIPIDYDKWQLTDRTEYSADETNKYDYAFETWHRK
ncbi:dihydrofolate reductase [Paucilactobacillus wasatchensis]|uniref:Dihydrofolate reductase n=1 Tax=Paucilactobacillus wasatchensis TaxID=1335616 RepID=A0A0D0Y423_9LACO|nr:dihydrofolate reductase [Paucilactobacillus wasatchensis]KIS03008.1 Dihydrofolate reductase [Paucilactobacillus wasatchensis]